MNTVNTAWPISDSLVNILKEALGGRTSGIISFRDQNYSAESGGYHPVEVSVGEGGNILYVTDFAYTGRPPHAELAKELDFDFSCGTFQHMGREYQIEEGYDTFKLWQTNFTTYSRWGVYQVSVEEI